MNADGTPKVVYHGTNAEFNTFQQENGAYFFSESRDYAESMADERRGNRIIEAYLKMKNPYTVKLSPEQFTDNIAEAPFIRYAKEHGHDGAILNMMEAKKIWLTTNSMLYLIPHRSNPRRITSGRSTRRTRISGILRRTGGIGI